MPKLSAGILPYRIADDGSLSVLLVHPGGPFWKNKDEHAWSIPKGEYGPDENPEEAAAREFTEELGLPVPEGPWLDLGTIRQSGGKHVRAWAVTVGQICLLEGMVSNRFEMEWPPRSGQDAGLPRGRPGRVDDDAAGVGPPRDGAGGVSGQVAQRSRRRRDGDSCSVLGGDREPVLAHVFGFVHGGVRRLHHRVQR